MKIGFLGPKGTFTYFACQQSLPLISNNKGAAQLCEYRSIDRLFDAYSSHQVDAIFLPIENSIEGPVNRVLDGLLHINGGISDLFTMPISQSLLSYQANLDSAHITDIVSMPHAIAQCHSFIQKNCPKAKLHHSPSTAGSIPLIDALQLPRSTTAIIGHSSITNYHDDIHIIQKNVHDQKDNCTQFGFIQPNEYQDIKPGPNRLGLIAFSTEKDQPGSLVSILMIFQSNHINLTKIVSRPQRDHVGAYIFYIEFDIMATTKETLKTLLFELKNASNYFKFLGCYEKISIHD